MLNVALIGVGKWGKNYYRILDDLHKKKIVNFKFISKFNIKKKHIKYFDKKILNINELFKKNIDALFITSPPESHYEIAKESLNRNIPVFIEKPFTLSYCHVRKIKNLLINKNLIFLINHQYLFSPYFLKLKKIINKKRIVSIYSEGHGVGPKRNYSTLWDWAPHDLSMIFSILGIKEKYYILSVKKTLINGGTNWNINLMYNEIPIKISIGNGYKKKTRKLIIEEKSDNIYIFNDKNINKNKLRKNNKAIFVKHKFPLENKINHYIKFVKLNKKEKIDSFKYMKDINLSLNIANYIEKISSNYY